MRFITAAVSRSCYVKTRCSESLEKKRLEAISGALANDFFQKAPTGMAILDYGGLIIKINQTLAQMNRLSFQDLLNHKVTEVWSAGHKLMKQLREIWQNGAAIINQEYSIFQPDSSISHQLWSIFPLSDPEGETMTIGCLIIDISERKQAEQALGQQWLREYLIGTIQERIRESLELDEVLNTAVTEVRKFLQTDRVIIWRFNSDSTRVVIAESVSQEWPKTLGMEINARCFWETYFPCTNKGRFLLKKMFIYFQEKLSFFR